MLLHDTEGCWKNNTLLSSTSVPLFQSEAMMFPTIFWKQNLDGSYPGAVPFPGLYYSSQRNASLGYASLEDHM